MIWSQIIAFFPLKFDRLTVALAQAWMLITDCMHQCAAATQAHNPAISGQHYPGEQHCEIIANYFTSVFDVWGGAESEMTTVIPLTVLFLMLD